MTHTTTQRNGAPHIESLPRIRDNSLSSNFRMAETNLSHTGTQLRRRQLLKKIIIKQEPNFASSVLNSSKSNN